MDGGMPVDAVVGQVDLSPDEPARPGRAPAVVEHLLERREELDAEVLDDRGPKPLRVVGGAGNELVIVVDPEPVHEAGGVGPGHIIGARLPDEGGHPVKAIVLAAPTGD
jgi:hypothetical protein